MSTILIVLDGLQDLTYSELGGKTPYDAGKGASFQTIESNCVTGSFTTTPAGFEPDTQTCMLALVGVPAKQIPSGRSYIEALAQGIEVGENDMIMRCNYVKVAQDGTLEVPCCSAPEPVAKALLEAVRAQGHSVTPVGSYKNLQCIKDGAPYCESMQTAPPHQHAGEPLEELLPSGNELADSLADFSRRMLKEHAPYTVYNWSHAVRTELPSFESLHGITGGMVSKTDALIGLARAMGMECPDLPTATGDTDTDLAAKVAATLELAKTKDFVVLHIGGPDEATHRQDPIEKADFVKRLDKELMAPLLTECEEGTVLLVTCDHEAYCTTGGHTTNPVHFMLHQKGAHVSGDYGVIGGEQCVNFAHKGEWRK